MHRRHAAVLLATVSTLTLFSSLGAAASTTWTGTAGNNLWTDPANWSAGLPGVADTAIFSNVAGPIDLGGAKEVEAMSIKGQLTLINGSITPRRMFIPEQNAGAALDAHIFISGDEVVFGALLSPFVVQGAVTGMNYRLVNSGPLNIRNVLDTNQTITQRKVLTLSHGAVLPNVPVLDVLQGDITLDNGSTGAMSERLNPLVRVDHTGGLPGRFILGGNQTVPVLESVSEVKSSNGVLGVLIRPAMGGALTTLHANEIVTSPRTLLGINADGQAARFTADTVPTQFGGGGGVEQPVVPFTVQLTSSSVDVLGNMMTYDLTPVASGGVVGFRPISDSEILDGFSGATPLTNVRVSGATDLAAASVVNSLTLEPRTQLSLGGDLTLNSGMLRLITDSQLNVTNPSISGTGKLLSTQPIHLIAGDGTSATQTLNIASAIDAPSLTVTAGNVRLDASNTLPNGVTLLSKSRMTVTRADALGNGMITINDSRLTFEGDLVINNAFNIQNGDSDPTGGSFTGSPFAAQTGQTITINGPVTGIGAIISLGGLLRLNGGGSFAGAIGSTLVASARIELNGLWTHDDSKLPLDGSGLLFGNATIPLRYTRGTISPGSPGEIGTLHIRVLNTTFPGSGSNGGKVLHIELDAFAADLLIVDELDIAASSPFSLDLVVLESLILGTQYSIVQVDAPTGAFGPFAGLSENSLITTGGYDFRISYLGGDGNDVTLTVVPEPASIAALGALVLLKRRRC